MYVFVRVFRTHLGRPSLFSGVGQERCACSDAGGACGHTSGGNAEARCTSDSPSNHAAGTLVLPPSDGLKGIHLMCDSNARYNTEEYKSTKALGYLTVHQYFCSVFLHILFNFCMTHKTFELGWVVWKCYVRNNPLQWSDRQRVMERDKETERDRERERDVQSCCRVSWTMSFFTRSVVHVGQLCSCCIYIKYLQYMFSSG